MFREEEKSSLAQHCDVASSDRVTVRELQAHEECPYRKGIQICFTCTDCWNCIRIWVHLLFCPSIIGQAQLMVINILPHPILGLGFPHFYMVSKPPSRHFFLPPRRRLPLSPSLLPAASCLSPTLAGRPAAALCRARRLRSPPRRAASNVVPPDGHPPPLCRSRPPAAAPSLHVSSPQQPCSLPPLWRSRSRRLLAWSRRRPRRSR